MCALPAKTLGTCSTEWMSQLKVIETTDAFDKSHESVSCSLFSLFTMFMTMCSLLSLFNTVDPCSQFSLLNTVNPCSLFSLFNIVDPCSLFSQQGSTVLNRENSDHMVMNTVNTENSEQGSTV